MTTDEEKTLARFVADVRRRYGERRALTGALLSCP